MEALVLEHEALPDDDLERLCACGCGEPLKPDAKRSYIHGHKIRQEEGRIPDDPEPSDEAKTKATVRVTAKIRAEMRDSLEAYLAMGAGVWATSDPICGEAVIDAAPAIANKLVPILSRNQAFVRYFRSSSSFKEGMDLFLVLYPVIRTIAAHHVFHTVGLSPQGEAIPVNYNDYVA